MELSEARGPAMRRPGNMRASGGVPGAWLGALHSPPSSKEADAGPGRGQWRRAPWLDPSTTPARGHLRRMQGL